MAANTPHTKKPEEPPYLDLLDLEETFADSVRSIVHDGQTWRIDFTVTRTDAEKLVKNPSAPSDAQHRVPSCRLVLTPHAGLDLLNKLTANAEALQAQGVLKKNEPPATPTAVPTTKH